MDTHNMVHLTRLRAPLERVNANTVQITYGYNSGGYANYVYFVTADGGTLAIDTVIAEMAKVDFTDKYDPQWFIIGCEINYEDNDLFDDHTGKQIECMY